MPWSPEQKVETYEQLEIDFKTDRGRYKLCFTDLSAAFKSNPNIVNVKLDTSSVTDMSEKFMEATAFNEDISDWDVGRATTMSGMFKGAAKFNSSYKAGEDYEWDWDIQSVKDISAMFEGATSFNGDISSWNVEDVEKIDNILSGATAFDHNLHSWYLNYYVHNLPVQDYRAGGVFTDNANKKIRNEYCQKWEEWFPQTHYAHYEPFFLHSICEDGLITCD